MILLCIIDFVIELDFLLYLMQRQVQDNFNNICVHSGQYALLNRQNIAKMSIN